MNPFIKLDRIKELACVSLAATVCSYSTYAVSADDLTSKGQIYRCTDSLVVAIGNDGRLSLAAPWALNVVGRKKLDVNSSSVITDVCYEEATPKPRYWVSFKALKTGSRLAAKTDEGVQIEIVDKDPRNNGNVTKYEKNHENYISRRACFEVKACSSEYLANRSISETLNLNDLIVISHSEPEEIPPPPTSEQKAGVLKIIESDKFLESRYRKGLIAYQKLSANPETAKQVEMYKTNFESSLFLCDGASCVRLMLEVWELEMKPNGTYQFSKYARKDSGGYPPISEKDINLSEAYYQQKQ